MDKQEWSEQIFEKAISPHLNDLGSIPAQNALEKMIQKIQDEERKRCIEIAKDHSKNCGACGCDGWQIALTIEGK